MPKYSLLNQDINTSFLNIETTWAGMRSPLLKKQVGYLVPDSFCELIKGETINYFQDARQAKIFSRSCARHILHDDKLLAAVRKKTVRLATLILKIAEDHFPLPRLTDQEIIKLLEKARNLQMDLAAWGMAVAFADIYGEISESVSRLFSRRKNLRYPVNLYLESLTGPLKSSLTALAYEKILSSRSDKYLRKKYFWLDQGYIGRGLSGKQLQNIRRHQQAASGGQKISRRALLKELKLSPAENKVLAVSAEMVYLKSLRSDVRQALYTVVNNIIDQLAARWRVPAKYLSALSTSELVVAIRQPEDIADNLTDRWQHSLFIPHVAGSYRVMVGAGVAEFLSSRLDIAPSLAEEISELRGQVAQPGKARGRVKLVFGSQHNFKVKRGDILVSVSTSPQLLPAMKLAAAYVTDMGGITSHAAIVAREFKKPCVVGTKIATKILHDGDLVEVDAEKGIVKIIKKR